MLNSVTYEAESGIYEGLSCLFLRCLQLKDQSEEGVRERLQTFRPWSDPKPSLDLSPTSMLLNLNKGREALFNTYRETNADYAYGGAHKDAPPTDTWCNKQ